MQPMEIKNTDFDQTRLLKGFWENRFLLNAEKSVYAVKKVFEDSGRFNALRFKKDNKKIHYYYDSDVAKWIEAVAYLLGHDRKKFTELETFCNELIDCIYSHQREDGYYNSYFLQLEPEKIFTDRIMHELYCAGHFIESAIAYHKYTGNEKYLRFAERLANCIKKVFYDDKSAPYCTDGHQEIELALFRLYEYTHNDDYKVVAEYFINIRGNNELDKKQPVMTLENAQDDIPIREMNTVVGHAVRATYYLSAVADMARIEKDDRLKDKVIQLFNEIINEKMYITGGVGSSRVGEAFTVPYDLPNLMAYSESCAAIGLILLCLRLQLLGVDAKYAEVAERVLYNGFLSSTSLDGKKFFYENPLEVCRKENGKDISAPNEFKAVLPSWTRKEVFSCSCCPPNINRFVASIEKVIFSKNEDGVFVNQYVSSDFENGTLTVQTDYPVSGKVKIFSNGYNYKKVYIRIPNDSYNPKFFIDKKQVNPTVYNGYAEFTVGKSFSIELVTDLTARLVFSNPKVRENAGKACVMKGPIVYCLEEIDNGEDLYSLSIDKNAIFKEEFNPEYGLYDLYCDGYRTCSDEKNSLYASNYPVKKVTLKFIPYYTFANRGESDMEVFVNCKQV